MLRTGTVRQTRNSINTIVCVACVKCSRMQLLCSCSCVDMTNHRSQWLYQIHSSGIHFNLYLNVLGADCNECATPQKNPLCLGCYDTLLFAVRTPIFLCVGDWQGVFEEHMCISGSEYVCVMALILSLLTCDTGCWVILHQTTESSSVEL